MISFRFVSFRFSVYIFCFRFVSQFTDFVLFRRNLFLFVVFRFVSLCFVSHFSAYVDILRNKTERSNLCKIRLSAHNLAIERGRHLGLHTSDRICTTCICKTGEVEDESHFLFKCEKYSNYRRSFQCNILSILQKNHLSENQMLKFCMNSNSLKVLRATCSYINNCLTLRNEIIQY